MQYSDMNPATLPLAGNELIAITQGFETVTAPVSSIMAVQNPIITRVNGVEISAETTVYDFIGGATINAAGQVVTIDFTNATQSVTSLNGEIGDVVVSTASIGAAPADHVGSRGVAHGVVTSTENGFMIAADKEKLDTVEVGATQNSTDVFLRDRTNHTGVQNISTIEGLVTILATKAEIPQTKQSIIVACGDEITPIVAGVTQVTFRMPYDFSLLSVRASLTDAQDTGDIITVDVNAGGISILDTLVTISNGEKTSKTAAIQPTLVNTTLVDDTEITVDVVQVGDGTAKGLKITLIGYVVELESNPV